MFYEGAAGPFINSCDATSELCSQCSWRSLARRMLMTSYPLVQTGAFQEVSRMPGDWHHHHNPWHWKATGSQRTESSDDSDADVDVTTIGDDSSKLPFLSPLFGKTKMNNVLSSKYHHRSSTQQNSASLLSSDDISALSQQKQSISEYLLQDKVKSSQQHSAVAPMPSNTGFSIEEIMRR